MEVEAPSESSPKTALIPLPFFEGKDLKPGTECKVRIERVLDGQAEVSYVPHVSELPEPGEDEGDQEMAGYMNE